jgi:hypothetical protein
MTPMTAEEAPIGVKRTGFQGDIGAPSTAAAAVRGTRQV